MQLSQKQKRKHFFKCLSARIPLNFISNRLEKIIKDFAGATDKPNTAFLRSRLGIIKAGFASASMVFTPPSGSMVFTPPPGSPVCRGRATSQAIAT